jgi:hypothetical protein
MRERNTVTVVVFVAPGSPVKMRTGKGPRPRSAAKRHETTMTNSSSSRMRSSALSFASPSLGSPCSGSGSACIPGERRKRMGGSLTIRQPLASTSIARQR